MCSNPILNCLVYRNKWHEFYVELHTSSSYRMMALFFSSLLFSKHHICVSESFHGWIQRTRLYNQQKVNLRDEGLHGWRLWVSWISSRQSGQQQVCGLNFGHPYPFPHCTALFYFLFFTSLWDEWVKKRRWTKQNENKEPKLKFYIRHDFIIGKWEECREKNFQAFIQKLKKEGIFLSLLTFHNSGNSCII